MKDAVANELEVQNRAIPLRHSLNIGYRDGDMIDRAGVRLSFNVSRETDMEICVRTVDMTLGDSFLWSQIISQTVQL